MKKTKTLALVLALSMAFTALFPINTPAAIGYTREKIDKSRTVVGEKATITVLHYFTYVILDEEDSAVKKINKKLKKQTQYLADESLATENAANDVDYIDYDAEYEDYTEQEVAYISDKYVSVASTSCWYAGGVSNYSVYGMTFDLSTGKEIKKITYFTKEKSLKKLKKKIKKLAMKEDPDLSEADVNAVLKDKKAKDFSFFINENGNVRVCFGPYEMGYGGWTRMYDLPGDVQ